MKIKQVMGNRSVLNIGHYPTPFTKLKRLSKKYNVQLYIKREDLSGPGFGGNKVRKLKYLLAEAVEQEADHVITYGALQTNHGRETVACCRALGIKPLLYLIAPSEPSDFLGNLLLNRIMDTEIHFVIPNHKISGYEAIVAAKENAKKRIHEIEKSGGRCYNIPPGGLTPVGCLGFVEGFMELLNQAQGAGIKPDYIVHASGTGGTLAGMIAGQILTDSTTQIISFSVDKEPPNKVEVITQYAQETLRLLSNKQIQSESITSRIHINSDYYGDGYEIPTSGATMAIQELACEEGVLLDPVYTGKAMHGLIDALKNKTIAQGSTIVFLHTGGTPALFAEKEITGRL